MLKYVNYDIVFQEFPDEVTLAINLSLCPCRCPGCHSSFLYGDIGTPFTPEVIDQLLDENGKKITCIGIMGGDIAPDEVNSLAIYIRQQYPVLKIGWYTGRTTIAKEIAVSNFNYIKVGPYIKHLGALNSPKTNQRMYKVGEKGELIDITARFWTKA